MITKDSRRKDRIMTNLMRGSDEYYRNHPDQPKEILEENRRSKEARDQWQMEHYGTVTTERDSRDMKYQKIIAVPVEIEVPDELDQLVKLDILETVGMTYSEWVERCYKERMKQILTDPTEWGKIMLDEVKRGHCFQEDSLED
jgi:uncharacterized protein YlbG (UPF0298 family)